MQRGTHDLGWVNDAFGDQVAVLAFLRVVAVGIGVIVADLADNN